MTAMIRASGLREYVALMHDLGVDPGPLLQRCGIAPALPDDEDALVSLHAAVQLLELSAAETGHADFGLRLSRRLNLGVLGPLSIVLQSASTARQALDYASRYLFVHSPEMVVTLREKSTLVPGAVEVQFEIRLKGQPPHRQKLDACLGDLHHIGLLLAGERYKLLAVSLPHRPLAPLAVYQRFFGAPVLVEQARAALHLGRETLDAPLRGANPLLRQVAENYLVTNFRNQGERVSARVRQALRRALGSAQANKADIAAMLAMHPRTLQRCLEEEQTSFEAVRDELRRDTALHYLRETTIPIGQLSGMLGFTEQATLVRSCRRWFGAPPSAVRRIGGAAVVPGPGASAGG